jgi:hypothetical protein
MWSIRRIVNFNPRELFSGTVTEAGYTPLGLHGSDGSRLMLGPERNWIGCARPGSSGLSWSAGPKTKKSGPGHIAADLDNPCWIADCGDGTYLVADAGHCRICGIDPSRGRVTTRIDLRPHGLRNPANCILDLRGNIWVNDPSLPALWVFTNSGESIRTFGATDGSARAEGRGDRPVPREMSLEDMDLGEVYDIRCGADGLIYILEGSRFRLRAVDFQRNMVTTVAGCGAPGYSGDGGDPRGATFGSAHTDRLDGPRDFCLDADNAIYIADTWNRAVRRIDAERARITTIAGGRVLAADRNDPAETDPLRLTLPSICWMEWREGKLFITDRCGDLVTLSSD